MAKADSDPVKCGTCSLGKQQQMANPPNMWRTRNWVSTRRMLYNQAKWCIVISIKQTYLESQRKAKTEWQHINPIKYSVMLQKITYMPSTNWHLPVTKQLHQSATLNVWLWKLE